MSSDPSRIWNQNADSLEVLFLLPEGKECRDVDVSITSNEIFAGCKGSEPLVEGRLFERIDSNSSMWQLDDSEEPLSPGPERDDGAPGLDMSVSYDELSTPVFLRPETPRKRVIIHLSKMDEKFWPILISGPLKRPQEEKKMDSEKIVPGIDAESEAELALYLWELQRNDGDKKLRDSAILHLESSAEKGNLSAQVSLGHIYEELKKYVPSLLYTKMAANQGEFSSCVRVGDAYQHGIGVRVCLTESLEWYERAATLCGHPSIYFKCGETCERLGKKRDASRWYMMGADLGYGLACVKLGAEAQESGCSDKAVAWFERAMELDPALAEECRLRLAAVTEMDSSAKIGQAEGSNATSWWVLGGVAAISVAVGAGLIFKAKQASGASTGGKKGKR